jgi:hypothetical protein
LRSTLNYTAYYPLYNADNVIIQSQIAKDNSFLSQNTRNIEVKNAETDICFDPLYLSPTG